MTIFFIIPYSHYYWVGGPPNLSRSIKAPIKFPEERLDPDVNIPTRLAFYSLTKIKAAAHIGFLGFRVPQKLRQFLGGHCKKGPKP